MWWIDQSPIPRLRKKPPPYSRPVRRHVGIGVEQEDKQVGGQTSPTADQEAMAAYLMQLKQRHGLVAGDNRLASVSSSPPTAAGVCVEEEEEAEEVESIVDVEGIELGMQPATLEPSTIFDSDADADESIPSPLLPPAPAEGDHQEQQPRPPSPLDAVTIRQVGLELEAALRTFRRQFTCSPPPQACGSEAAVGGRDKEEQMALISDEQAEASVASNDLPALPLTPKPPLLPRRMRAAPPSLAFAKAFLEEFRAYR